MTKLSYLALGDSYTIGELVPLYESFPYQTLQHLRKAGLPFYAPEIIAKTGWTTDELEAGIAGHVFLDKYDLVTLLIGVNNQYRGRSVEEFEIQFRELLKKAIEFSGNNTRHVFVLSIPDWGITPFAADREVDKIAQEIDLFNAVCKKCAEEYGVDFLDNSASTRADGDKSDFLASDQLHPSVKEYAKWAEKLANKVNERFKGE